MGKHEFYSSKAIKKDTEQLNDIGVQVEKKRIKLRCKCRHRDKNGDITTVNGTKKLENGEVIIVKDGVKYNIKIYRCSICGAQIVKLKLSNEEAGEMFDKMISLLDYYKFAIPGNSDKDLEQLANISEAQYALAKLKPVYAVLRKQVEKRNKNRDRDRDSGSCYIKSNY